MPPGAGQIALTDETAVNQSGVTRRLAWANVRALFMPIDLTADVTGDLPVADGGTGASTQGGAQTNLDVDPAGTDNSIDVTLAGAPDYLTIAGQVITRALVNLNSHTTDLLSSLRGGTGRASLTLDQLLVGNDTGPVTFEVIPAGGLVGETAPAVLTQKEMRDVRFTVTSSGSQAEYDLDFSNASMFLLLVGQDTDIDVSNFILAADAGTAMTIHMLNATGSDFTVTWPAGWRWIGDPPAARANTTTIVEVRSDSILVVAVDVGDIG